MEKQTVKIVIGGKEYIFTNVDRFEEIKAIDTSKIEEELTYENVVEKLFKHKYYYISEFGYIQETDVTKNHRAEKNNASSFEQLESSLAENMLMNVAVYLNDGWEPDWDDNETKWFFYLYQDNIEIGNRQYTHSGDVFFKAKELAEKARKILGYDIIRKAITKNHKPTNF